MCIKTMVKPIRIKEQTLSLRGDSDGNHMSVSHCQTSSESSSSAMTLSPELKKDGERGSSAWSLALLSANQLIIKVCSESFHSLYSEQEQSQKDSLWNYLVCWGLCIGIGHFFQLWLYYFNGVRTQQEISQAKVMHSFSPLINVDTLGYSKQKGFETRKECMLAP